MQVADGKTTTQIDWSVDGLDPVSNRDHVGESGSVERRFSEHRRAFRDNRPGDIRGIHVFRGRDLPGC